MHSWQALAAQECHPLTLTCSLHEGDSSNELLEDSSNAVLGGPFDLVSRVSKVGYGGL